MFVSSPSYNGLCADVRGDRDDSARTQGLRRRRRGLGRTGPCTLLPEDALSQGADIIVTSVHKMLSGVSQVLPSRGAESVSTWLESRPWWTCYAAPACWCPSLPPSTARGCRWSPRASSSGLSGRACRDGTFPASSRPRSPSPRPGDRRTGVRRRLRSHSVDRLRRRSWLGRLRARVGAARVFRNSSRERGRSQHRHERQLRRHGRERRQTRCRAEGDRGPRADVGHRLDTRLGSGAHPCLSQPLSAAAASLGPHPAGRVLRFRPLHSVARVRRRGQCRDGHP